VSRLLVGVALESLDVVPARGDTIWHDGREVGQVTSAGRGLTLGKALALGFVSTEVANAGTPVTIRPASGGQAFSGVVHTKAFYDPERVRVRT